MAEALVIARVAAIQGEVFARSPDGKVRRLQVNDPIREGDVVIPGQGGRIDLALADGTTKLVRSGEQLTVDAEVAAEVKPDARDAALVTGKGEIDKVIKAMNAARTLGGKRKRGEPEAPAAPTEKTCPFCKSKIAVDATRCPYCTSEVD